MPQEFIVIRGARENNLKNVSLGIPKRQITVFTGVSGSGKSSLVIDTIAAEAQRQLNDTFSTFIRTFLPRYAQPDADVIENLSMAIVVDQKRLGGGPQSTVGTVTDIFSVLRLLFSRVGQPYVGPATAFSFKDPLGMCPACHGVGRMLGVDLGVFLDTAKSLNEGAILFPEIYPGRSWQSDCIQSGLFDNDKRLADFTADEMELLLHGKPYKVKLVLDGKPVNFTFEGVVEKFTQKYITRDLKSMSERTQKIVAPFMSEGPCSLCRGTRLSPAVLGCTIHGYNIADLASMEVDDLIAVVRTIDDPVAAPMVASLTERLHHMIAIGLGYLSLNRETDTLSGGESQRLKMVKHLGSSLVDILYVFDEPSVGLHPRDVHRLNELLQKLRDKGNTVLVVEHDRDVIKVADHVVDLGPHAGTRGGTIVYEGSYAGLLQANTLTATHLNQSLPIKERVRSATGKLSIAHATINNLQDVSVDLPMGVLTVVTGVAGSGKSSLIHQTFLRRYPDAVVVDQSAIGTSSRSNPATYTGMMDAVRKAFATANKVSPSLFSFNSQGACDNCQGLGVIYINLAYLDEVKTPCEACGGKRFKDDVLAYKLLGKSISDVLALSVQQALEYFTLRDIVRTLEALRDVGLDYLTLGQPLSTLSGGECQRLKLAGELHKEGSIYVLDEPTTGLHMSDITHLLAILNRLVDAGNTVIVIEHNQDVIRNADWIIDMGPEGGHRGGRVLFEGTPMQLLSATESITSAFLQR